MDVYLIRHAHASSRTSGSSDKYRQLSEEGWEQAKRLVDFFAPVAVSAVWSSPATRCYQTVQPLATLFELSVVESNGLWEDASVYEVFGAIQDACDQMDESATIIVCSHGNLIPPVVEQLAVNGATISGRGCERASMWRLRSTAGNWTEAQYLTPRLDYRV